MNIYSFYETCQNIILFNREVVSIVFVIFIRHLKPFLNEQRILSRYYGKNMSFKTPEKVPPADRMEQHAITRVFLAQGPGVK